MTASTKRRDLFIVLLLGVLSTVTPFAVDMYLPAFSTIAARFGTTSSTISLSLSSYFVGFALGQVIYGPLLDRYGRKKPVYAGLLIYMLAALGCAHADNIEALAMLRFLQALGGCAAQVAAVTMVRDFFPARASAKVFSLLFLIIGVSPLLAPTIGSIILIWHGWEFIFYALAVFAAFILAKVFFLLPDPHRPDPSISLRPSVILSVFGEIFRLKQFHVYAISGAFSFAGLFTYVAGSPVVFMEGFKVSAQAYGLIFAVLTMGFVGGNQVNVFLLKKYTSQQIYNLAVMVQAVIGVTFIAGTLSGIVGLYGTLGLFFMFLSSTGLTYPNAAAIALAPFSKNAGSASALLGFLQMGTGALVSMAIGMFQRDAHIAVIGILAVTSVIAVAILKGAERSGLRHPNDKEEAELPAR